MTSSDKLLVSVHDVTPRHFAALKDIDRLLGRLGIGSCYSMLVVPNFWSAWPLEEHPEFVEWLRARESDGVEMILHGFYHRDQHTHRGAAARVKAGLMTAGEGEFLGLGYADAAARISAGKAVLESALEQPVEGFVAPAWLYGEATRQVLRDQSFRFAEDHWSVWAPALDDRRLARSPVISYSSRTRMRIATSWLWSRSAMLALSAAPVVRHAIHPHDLDSGLIVSEIERSLTSLLARREVMQYRHLAARAH